MPAVTSSLSTIPRPRGRIRTLTQSLPASATNQPFLRDQVSCTACAQCDLRRPDQFHCRGVPGFMPAPNRPGELNNYILPRAVPITLINGSNVYMFRIDHYIGDKDHFYFTFWRQYARINTASELPREIATESPTRPQNSPIPRFNWEHTFGPTLPHHLSVGYLNRNEGYGSLNVDQVGKLPQIRESPAIFTCRSSNSATASIRSAIARASTSGTSPLARPGCSTTC